MKITVLTIRPCVQPVGLVVTNIGGTFLRFRKIKGVINTRVFMSPPLKQK
jgi:hypothetical protein